VINVWYSDLSLMSCLEQYSLLVDKRLFNGPTEFLFVMTLEMHSIFCKDEADLIIKRPKKERLWVDIDKQGNIVGGY